jgi:hypothetical protein
MYWVYDLPNWLFGVLTVLLFCAFGIGGMMATRRWVSSLHHSEASHNDIVGYYFGAITVFYGITLGLLMVDVWTTFSEAQQKVDREASSVAAFYRDISNFSEPSRSDLQNDLRRYIRTVIDVGWPLQQKGIVPRTPNKTELDDMGRHLAAYEPATEAQKILLSEAFHQYNEVVELRRSRHVSVTAGLSSSLWAACVDRGRDQHSSDVGISYQKQKNASLYDCLSVIVAGTNGLPSGSDGSSIYGKVIGVFAAFSNCV